MNIDSSIIIVNFNTRDITIKCLQSIYEHTKKTEFEIIVVDNNSSDSSVEVIKRKFPRVRLINNKHNAGFGTANNQAAKIAKGKYLLFLNSDTYLTEDSIDQIINWTKNHPYADVVACKTMDTDNNLQFSIGFFPTLIRIKAWALFFDDLPIINKYFPAYHLENDRWYKQTREIDWAQGSFMFMKREVFQKTNGFDEKMFMYGEEVELQMRIRSLGYHIYFVPITSIVHLGRASSDQVSSGFTLISEFKGLLYIYQKHHPAWHLPLLKLILKIGITLRILIFEYILQRKQMKGVYREALAKI